MAKNFKDFVPPDCFGGDGGSRFLGGGDVLGRKSFEFNRNIPNKILR